MFNHNNSREHCDCRDEGVKSVESLVDNRMGRMSLRMEASEVGSEVRNWPMG